MVELESRGFGRGRWRVREEGGRDLILGLSGIIDVNSQACFSLSVLWLPRKVFAGGLLTFFGLVLNLQSQILNILPKSIDCRACELELSSNTVFCLLEIG